MEPLPITTRRPCGRAAASLSQPRLAAKKPGQTPCGNPDGHVASRALLATPSTALRTSTTCTSLACEVTRPALKQGHRLQRRVGGPPHPHTAHSRAPKCPPTLWAALPATLFYLWDQRPHPRSCRTLSTKSAQMHTTYIEGTTSSLRHAVPCARHVSLRQGRQAPQLMMHQPAATSDAAASRPRVEKSDATQQCLELDAPTTMMPLQANGSSCTLPKNGCQQSVANVCPRVSHEHNICPPRSSCPQHASTKGFPHAVPTWSPRVSHLVPAWYPRGKRVRVGGPRGSHVGTVWGSHGGHVGITRKQFGNRRGSTC